MKIIATISGTPSTTVRNAATCPDWTGWSVRTRISAAAKPSRPAISARSAPTGSPSSRCDAHARPATSAMLVTSTSRVKMTPFTGTDPEASIASLGGRPHRVTARRACLEMAAANLARNLDPQDDGYIGAPRRPDLDAAAADGHVIGVDHDAGLGQQRQHAAAHVGVDLERRPRDHRLGEVERYVAALDPHLDPRRHEPAAFALGPAATPRPSWTHSKGAAARRTWVTMRAGERLPCPK